MILCRNRNVSTNHNHYKEKEWLKDRRRDNYLNELGFTVLRYSNMDINKNFEGVCIDIKKHLIF